jgi:hypothetical protein
MPSVDAVDRDETVLVWGGSTSVGSNAIQLARCAGYRVVTTASPRNFDYVRSLGAAAAVDYHSRTAVGELVDQIGHSPLAGTLAIGSGSLARTVTIASRTTGSRRIATVQPALLTRIQALRARRTGVRISSIWGGTLKDDEVGPGIYVDFLPAALREGVYRGLAPSRESPGAAEASLAHWPGRFPGSGRVLDGSCRGFAGRASVRRWLVSPNVCMAVSRSTSPTTSTR